MKTNAKEVKRGSLPVEAQDIVLDAIKLIQAAEQLRKSVEKLIGKPLIITSQSMG